MFDNKFYLNNKAYLVLVAGFCSGKLRTPIHAQMCCNDGGMNGDLNDPL